MTDPIKVDHRELCEAKFDEGERRMTSIEQTIGRIDSDLRPIKNLYHAVVGAAGVGAAIFGLMLYIYSEDKTQQKGMHESLKSAVAVLNQHSIALEKLLQSHQELEKDTVKEFQRIEKTIENLHKR